MIDKFLYENRDGGLTLSRDERGRVEVTVAAAETAVVTVPRAVAHEIANWIQEDES